MSLTEYERRQLAIIGRAVEHDDPALADRLARLAPVSRHGRRLCRTALGTLLACAVALVGMSFEVARPVCLAGAATAAAVALTVGAGWRWRLRRRSPRTPPHRFRATPPALGRR
ncbi:hypothetical protein Athai_40460 [Actinocatenispora thailandica]|uniref:DUF3040 domain-containing protein n=1 Tax=Actinocatenispora thailandica TaxID=227318 RepID=A0A7R7HXZ7_9ACTN|nr:DUF3040 domain-containing protein [Actinocatenispora thailandica]BCJ36543.1 hypothetical protein Athai_40460 [Actinocatenispora thailandica]